jgi:hypothetical protein
MEELCPGDTVLKVVYDDMKGTKQHLKSVVVGVGERHTFSGKIY